MSGEAAVVNAGKFATITDRSGILWGLAFLFYGIGDSVTTLIGLRTEGVEEVGPIALMAMDIAGDLGFLILKLAFLVACVAVWWLLETRAKVAIPLALIVAGIAVTAWNTVVLLL